MAEAKHSQAPWTNIDGYIYGLEGSIPVAEVTFNMYSREEYAANTFLIKMSPELLAIAEMVMDRPEWQPLTYNERQTMGSRRQGQGGNSHDNTQGDRGRMKGCYWNTSGHRCMMGQKESLIGGIVLGRYLPSLAGVESGCPGHRPAAGITVRHDSRLHWVVDTPVGSFNAMVLAHAMRNAQASGANLVANHDG